MAKWLGLSATVRARVRARGWPFLMVVFCLVRPIRLLRQVIFFIYFFNYDKHHEQYHVQIPNSI